MTRQKRERLLFERGPFCAICGRLILKGRVTLDHRKPILKGGGHHLDNLDLAHKRCNETKGHKGKPAVPIEPSPCTWCVAQTVSRREPARRYS